MELNKNTKLLLGPPGTGKTTTLLSIVEEELKKVAPNKIAFVSFTKKATEEAAGRACAKFNFTREDLPWFRTLHSFAYRCAGRSRDDIFDRKHCISLGRKLGVFIGYSSAGEEGISVADSNVGTAMLFLDNLSRIKCEALRVSWSQYNDERIAWAKMDWFSKSYAKYKEEEGVVDFTDLIADLINKYSHKVPKLDVLIVDEAQDLTQLQWRMIQVIARGAKRVYIAGDDDQAIYTWSGADVHTFLTLKCKERIVLNHSYRLPKEVWDVSQGIVSRITQRYDKTWNPRKGQGSCSHVFTLDGLDLDHGNWLILARNRCFAEEMAAYLMERGVHFSCPFSNPIPPDVLDAIIAWEALRKGEAITVERARGVYKFMKSGTGVARGFKGIEEAQDTDKVKMSDLTERFGLRTTEIWHKAMERIVVAEREYLISILKKHEKVRHPRVSVGTIHGSKGGECDNVLLLTDITRRVQENQHRDPDLEHRVFYVGATRAKENLMILGATTPNHYKIS